MAYETERRTDVAVYRASALDSVPVRGAARENEYEIFRAARGEFFCTAEGREYELSTGDILFTLPGERHSAAAVGEAHSGQVVWLSREYLFSKFPDVAETVDKKPPGAQNRIPAIIADKYGFDTIFERLHDYASSDHNGADTMLALYAVMLIAKIGEILAYERASGEHRARRNIKKIIEYINENAFGAITLDAIAGHMYLDKSYVCRLFKRETGLTINVYINTVRIAEAKRLIADGISPRGASARCGYNDYSTFYRAFRRFTGTSPDEFRRRADKNPNGGE